MGCLIRTMVFAVIFIASFCACLIVVADDNDLNAVPKTVGLSPAATSHKMLDTVHLKSGGILKGEIQKEIKGEGGRTYLIFRTESGGLLKLDSSRLIKKNGIKSPDKIDFEYQRRLKICADDPNLHWKLHQWCQDQPSGSIRFKEESEYILRKIVELDPNDEKARRKLGYRFVDGNWVIESQRFAGQGYHKEGTGWAPNLQTGVNERAKAKADAEGARRQQHTQWLKMVKRNNTSKGELQRRLNDFCDDIAVSVIMKKGIDDKSPEVRLLYIEAFGRLKSANANRTLCHFVVNDPNELVRERALTLLQQEHFDKSYSASRISQAFAANDNKYVRRAAFAIGELGPPSAVLSLVGALQTTHRFVNPGSEPGRMTTSFDNQGGVGMQTGGGPRVREEVVSNEATLNALKKITGQNFGFDEEAWQNWYIENYTLYDVDVRDDE